LNFAQAPADFAGSGPQIRHTLIQKKNQDLCVESLNVAYLQGEILIYAFALAFW
jgi:hypothetical protein